MNLGGHHRRSVGSAWQVGFGNIGGIIATYAFIAKDAPRYTKGYAICLGFLCLAMASCCAYAAAVWRENRRREKTPVDVGLTEYEKTELGVSFSPLSLVVWFANFVVGYESGVSLFVVDHTLIWNTGIGYHNNSTFIVFDVSTSMLIS